MTEEFLIYHGQGLTFTAVTASGVTAGDLVYAAASDDVFSSFNLRSVSYDDITVETATTSEDALIVGIAVTTAAASGTVAVVTEGIYLYQGDSTTGVTAGTKVTQGATAQRLTDAASDTMHLAIGRGLSGTSNAASKYGLFLLRV